jgi:hypothetical protein
MVTPGSPEFKKHGELCFLKYSVKIRIMQYNWLYDGVPLSHLEILFFALVEDDLHHSR